MPTLLHQTRYRPLLPFVPPAALSPGADDEQSLAINPQFADYLGGADDSDQWRGGGRDNTPPVPPIDARESSMPPPGLAQPPAPAAPQQAPGMARRALVGPPPVPQAPAPPEDPQLDEGMAPGAELPAAAPQDDAEPPAFDYKTRRKELLADLQKNSTPAEKGTHWAQRLGMALLAGTKLGPVANMIVHPKWSEQEHRRQAALASDEDQLKALNTAEGGEALTEQRQATAEQKRREKARDNYITVPGGGLFNTAEKRWERQPADRSQLTPISKEQADAIGLQPLEDGTYAIPNSAVGSLITSQKDPKGAKTIEEQILRIRDDDDNYPTPELKQGVIDALIKDHNRLHPTAPIHGIETDKSGNATLVVADPSDPTSVKKVPLGAIGKPQQESINDHGVTMIGGDGKVYRLQPGQAVPAGARTAAGVNSENVPTAQTRSMAEVAPKVIGFVDRIGKLIDEQEANLGPGSSRFREFVSGKVGASDPSYTKLRTDIGLLQTALMRMHVGARGGEQMMEHFKSLIDVSKQDPDNLRAALGEIKEYAKSVGAAHAAGSTGAPTAEEQWTRDANGRLVKK